jgi:hypothetical protein
MSQPFQDDVLTRETMTFDFKKCFEDSIRDYFLYNFTFYLLPYWAGL